MPNHQIGWSDERAIEMIPWVYLNRIQLMQITMVDAIGGSDCGACYDPNKGLGISATQLQSESWVSVYVQKNVEGPIHGEAWRNAQKMVIMVENKWIRFGTGSYVDPTNGSENFHVRVPAERTNLVKIYEIWTKYYPGFRWAVSEPFLSGGKEYIFFTQTNFPPDQ